MELLKRNGMKSWAGQFGWSTEGTWLSIRRSEEESAKPCAHFETGRINDHGAYFKSSQ